MARRRREADGPDFRGYLVDVFARLLRGGGWRAEHLGGLAGRLAAGEPVTVSGWLLGDLRPADVAAADRVRVGADGSLTVLPRRGVR